MRIKVTIEDQPREFIRRQPPDIRKQLREALHALENGEIFSEPLEDELEGFYKLKVHRHRFIIQSVAADDGPFFRVIFAERRKAVYELFSQILGLQ
jgi:mRNA-degrading endonuclease RelE of RelBE toxin-antitoxin system